MSCVFRAGCALALLLTVQFGAGRADDLDEVKTRLALEAQRVEREFTEGRASAYKLVRSSTPDYVAAFSKLTTLLGVVEADKSLDPKRRELLLVTLKYDLGKIKDVADESRRPAATSPDLPRAIRSDVRRDTAARLGLDSKRAAGEADRLLASRGKLVADARTRSLDYNDRTSRVLRSVEDSATPEAGDYVLPRDWAELSKRRLASSGVTEKEREILRALDSITDADYQEQTFQQVIDHLEKVTGLSIAVDKRAIEEAGVTYDSPIKLKLKTSTRFVLRRLLGDLGLTYVVRNEGIFVTSVARAREMTTVRKYYIGDIASTVDVRLPLVIAQAQMVETVNRIMTMITQTVDPRSWQANDPDGVGTITFEPVSMSLVIRQSAEVHYRLGGGR